MGGLYPLMSIDINEQGGFCCALLVEAAPPFCPSWGFLSQVEGVLLSCSVAVMGMSFFDIFSLFSMFGGLSMVVGLLLCFVLCVAYRTVFVILLVMSGQLMFCSSSLCTWFSSVASSL